MRQIKFFIGTDVSKEWLDMCILLEGEAIHRQQIKNKETAIRKWFKQTQKQYGYLIDNSLFTMEYTGIYNHHLLEVLHEAGANIGLYQVLKYMHQEVYSVVRMIKKMQS